MLNRSGRVGFDLIGEVAKRWQPALNNAKYRVCGNAVGNFTLTPSAKSDARFWRANRTFRAYEASGDRLPCCALWIEDGTIPKYLRKTRLKCDELEKPHENATSVIVFPPWASSS
jgi:hypothetical protein